ncbi:hypothetical protein ACFPT7_10935 [Acidicapsa dinghuensis]|uniref:DUF1186 domain-containing protein n=1 Tax=Acidicapsa dinghuensis TaxID=2218256 RepID=A0ABW1EEP6_9BACT|nr:hypothetical protein [Acidicapsa dinghuensis]
MLRDFLESLRPDKDLLLSEISKHISDDMLAKIALADYGQDQEQHFAALRLLRDKHIFAEPMHWYPCEVLELVRYSEPDGSPEPEREKEHWIRAFSSAALLRAMQSPWNYSADGASPSLSLIQLIGSLEALPINFSGSAVRFLAWMMLHPNLEQGDEQPIYYGIALLWLALRIPDLPFDQDLLELAEWVVRREAEIREGCPWAFDRWLLGIAHDPPPSKWEPLGTRLANLDLSGRSRELRNWIKLIGLELAGQSFSGA